MKQMEMDLFAAREARDKAVERVETNAGDWSSQARNAFRRIIPPGWEGTGEDIRFELTKNGVPQPHHHNAWGPFIVGIRKIGWITPTGRYKNMSSNKSHARESKIYRRSA